MDPQVNLFFNNQKLGAVPLSPSQTIAGLKEYLRAWLLGYGVTNYTVRMQFNNGSYLGDQAFTTKDYDIYSFKTHEALLNGASIYITQVAAVPQQVTVVQQQQQQQVTPENVQATAPKVAATETAPTKRGEETKEELEEMKVVELKELLKARGLKVSGTKAELVARLLSGEGAPSRRGRKPAAAPAPVTAPTTTLAPVPAPATTLAPVGRLAPPSPGSPNETPVGTPNGSPNGTPTGTPTSPRTPLSPTLVNLTGTIYALKNEETDNYIGFRTKAAAIRWWAERHEDDAATIFDGLDGAVEGDYDNDDVQDAFDEAMLDDDNPVLEVDIAE